MQGEWRRSRALRGTALGLANGLSLIFLAALVAAYWTGGTPIASVDGLLTVATAWLPGATGVAPAWILGLLGVAVILVSPVWFFLVRPTFGDALDAGQRTEPEKEPEEQHEEGSGEPKESTTRAEDDVPEDSATTEDEGSGFVWGSESDAEDPEFSREQPDDESDFVWEDSSES